MRRILFCLFAALTAVACGKDETDKDRLDLSTPQLSVPASGETVSVNISANTTFTVDMPDEDWVIESVDMTSSESVMYFDVAANSTDLDRDAKIVFTTPGNLQKTLTISQDKRLFEAEPEYRFEATGGPLSFSVDYDSDYTVRIFPSTARDWIKEETPGTRASSQKSLSFDIRPNTGTLDREAMISITSGDNKQEINVLQWAKSFVTASAEPRNLSSSGEVLSISVSHNVDFDVVVSASARSWVTRLADSEPASRAATEETVINFDIARNALLERSGTITLRANGVPNVVIPVSQEKRVSTDLSADGDVVVVQRATEGNGINVVFLGDGFTDFLVEDGTYMDLMNRSVDYFFDVEPYKSFRHFFNVYIVKTVSRSIKFGTEPNPNGGDTALKTWFSDTSTRVGGSKALCMAYTKLAVDESLMDETLSVIVINRSGPRNGTCNWSYPTIPTDYGSGYATAYQSLSQDNGTNGELRGLIQHECGHGFAKLMDEYIYEGYEDGSDAPEKQAQRNHGWYKNADWTNNLSEIRWAKFVTDPRYQAGELSYPLGAFEGAVYRRSIWKPTDSSIMKTNFGKFNAPSREAIYYRIHKLAYGPSWVFDYEEFVAWDTKNFDTSAQSAKTPSVLEMGYIPPPSPPEVSDLTWREEWERGKNNPEVLELLDRISRK